MFWVNLVLSIIVGMVGVMAACGTLMLPMLLDDDESTQKRSKALLAGSVVLLVICCVAALVIDWAFGGGILWLLLPIVPGALVALSFVMESKSES